MKRVEVKRVPMTIPQAALVDANAEPAGSRVISGNCSFTTVGLGITPANQFGLIQRSESPEKFTVLEKVKSL